MFKNLFYVISLFFAFTTSAYAQSDFARLLNLNFDSLSGFSLGDGVDYGKLYTPAGNCTKISGALITDDTPGAVEVRVKIELLASASELERKNDSSLITTLGADTGLKDVFSVNATNTQTSTYNWFLNQKSSALVLRIKVYADYGRSVLDYNLKDEFKGMLDPQSPDYDQFKSVCGTHFIRAVQKEASLVIDMKVSQLSKDEHETIVENTNTTLTGNGTFSNGITLGGNYSVDSKLTEFEKFASQFGNVSIEMRGRGAPGFSGIDKIIYLDDGKPSTVSNYLTRVGQLVGEFETADGAPTTFIIQKYPLLPDDEVDVTRVLHIDKILSTYAHFKGFADYYENIKISQPLLWSQHFQNELAAVSATIDTLDKRFKSCREDNECNLSIPEKIQHKTHEDLLETTSLKGSCANYLKSFDGGNPVLSMSDVAIIWRGEINYPNFVDLNSVSAFQIFPNGYKREFSAERFRSVRDFSVDPAFLKSVDFPLAKGPGRAISQVVNVKIPSANVLDNGQVKPQVLNDIRNEYANSIFGLSFQFSGGPEVTQMLGKPDMSNCQIVRPQ